MQNGNDLKERTKKFALLILNHRNDSINSHIRDYYKKYQG